jgi:hypothetical protein
MVSGAACSTVSKEKVHIDKGEEIPLGKLDVAGLSNRNLNPRLPGENCNDLVGRVADGLVNGIACSRSETRQLGSGSKILKENKVRPALPQKSREARQIW